MGFGWLGPFKVTGGTGQEKAVDTWTLETILAALAPPKPKGLLDLNDAETAYHQAAAGLHGEVVNLESGSSDSDGKKALEKNN